MIESRYKIEYILPDEEVKKTSSFRVLWYLFLISLILLLVTVITYDFSLKNISRDSLALVEKAKADLLNLSDEQEIYRSGNTGEQKSRNKPNVEQTFNNILVSNVVSQTPPKQTVNRNEIEISKLAETQKRQTATIEQKISENSELAQSLETLSEQLLIEKNKNEELNSQLTEQTEDSLKSEKHVKRISEKSGEITNLENTIIQTNEEKTILKTNIVTPKTPTEIAVSTSLSPTKAKEDIPLSKVDRIVAAMPDEKSKELAIKTSKNGDEENNSTKINTSSNKLESSKPIDDIIATMQEAAQSNKSSP